MLGHDLPKRPSTRPTRKPQRTCVACRQVAPQRSLVRLVANGGVLAADVHRNQAGRGAYLHPGTSAPGTLHHCHRGAASAKQLTAALERTLRCKLTAASVATACQLVAEMVLPISSNQDKPTTTL